MLTKGTKEVFWGVRDEILGWGSRGLCTACSVRHNHVLNLLSGAKRGEGGGREGQDRVAIQLVMVELLRLAYGK